SPNSSITQAGICGMYLPANRCSPWVRVAVLLDRLSEKRSPLEIPRNGGKRDTTRNSSAPSSTGEGPAPGSSSKRLRCSSTIVSPGCGTSREHHHAFPHVVFQARQQVPLLGGNG